MRRWRTSWMLPVILGMAFMGGAARAQVPYTRPNVANPYAQPAYSPYLNLLRGGSSPAINYYGLVRPQQEFRTGIQQLTQQTIALDQGVAALDATAAGLTTGHHTSFLTHTRYFLNQNAQTGGGLRPGAGLTGGTTAGLSTALPTAGYAKPNVSQGRGGGKGR